MGKELLSIEGRNNLGVNTMAIRTIINVDELESVRVCWEKWQNHPNSDLDHFKLVCHLSSEVECPHITVMEHHNQPCALLIARLEQTSFVPSIGYFKPVRIPAKILTVLYQGLLGPGRLDKEIGKTIIRYLRSFLSSGEADAVVFHNLPEHSLLLQALLLRCPRWLCEKKPAWSTHWSMALPEQPGFLLKRMKSKHRSWIRGRQKKLEAAFPSKISWRWMSHFDNVPELCARLEPVAARTYQRGLGSGFVNDKKHRQRFTLFASRNQLRVQLLEIEGTVRAFWIGTIYKGVFHSSATGYDPDLRIYEPGTLIFIRMVDELVREGIRKIDFGLGNAHYKQRFGNQCWRETTVRLFAPTTKGVALRSSLRLCAILDRAGRHLLQKTGMMDRLKTDWRRLLTPTKL